jgi:hypothetical protein
VKKHPATPRDRRILFFFPNMFLVIKSHETWKSAIFFFDFASETNTFHITFVESKKTSEEKRKINTYCAVTSS